MGSAIISPVAVRPPFHHASIRTASSSVGGRPLARPRMPETTDLSAAHAAVSGSSPLASATTPLSRVFSVILPIDEERFSFTPTTNRPSPDMKLEKAGSSHSFSGTGSAGGGGLCSSQTRLSRWNSRYWVPIEVPATTDDLEVRPRSTSSVRSLSDTCSLTGGSSNTNGSDGITR